MTPLPSNSPKSQKNGLPECSGDLLAFVLLSLALILSFPAVSLILR